MAKEKNLSTDVITTDLSELDLTKVKQFVEDGKPGIASVSDSVLHKMMDLYLTGSTYRQISQTLNIKKVMILYLSKTYGWFETRQEYFHELNVEIKNRILNSKLVSQEFLLLLIQAYQKKIGGNIVKYLATDDTAHMEKIDLKEMDKLMKAMEVLGVLSENTNTKSKSPAVGLNLGEGVTIERSGDNKVTITPRSKTLGEMLKRFADDQREEANKSNKNEKTSDITEEETTKEE